MGDRANKHEPNEAAKYGRGFYEHRARVFQREDRRRVARDREETIDLVNVLLPRLLGGAKRQKEQEEGGKKTDPTKKNITTTNRQNGRYVAHRSASRLPYKSDQKIFI